MKGKSATYGGKIVILIDNQSEVYINYIFIYQGMVIGNVYHSMVGKWFEPRGISYWFVVIVRVKVVFRKTVVGD